MPGPVGVTSAPLQLLQPNQQTGISLQNSGSNTLYLGDTSNVSAGNYDYQISPGGGITWSPGRALFVVAAAGAPTTVNYMESLDGASATNVTATISGTVPVTGNVNSFPQGTTSIAGTVFNNVQANSTLLGQMSLNFGAGQAAGTQTIQLVNANSVLMSNYSALQIVIIISQMSGFPGVLTFDPTAWLAIDVWQSNAVVPPSPVGTVRNHAEWFLTRTVNEYSFVVPAYKLYAGLQFTQGNLNALAATGGTPTYQATAYVFGLVDPAPSVRYVSDFFGTGVGTIGATFGDTLAESGFASLFNSQTGASSTTTSFPVSSRNKPTQMNLFKTNNDTGNVAALLYAYSAGVPYKFIQGHIAANQNPQENMPIAFNAPCLPLYETLALRTATTDGTIALTQ